MAVLKAEYFTDPICSWSWGNEPNYRKLRVEYGGQIEWRHRIGCLYEKWSEEFYDPLYDIHGGNAEEVMKHQDEVARETEQPIDTRVWRDHPPPSSVPLCIAAKAVGFQGWDLEDKFIRRMREAILTENRVLADLRDLLELAAEIPDMDFQRLDKDIYSDAAKQACREDWETTRKPVPEARDTKVTEGHLRYSFPALLLTNREGKYRLLDGSDPYRHYVRAIEDLESDLVRYPPPEVETFVGQFGRVTTKETSVVCDISMKAAETALERLVSAGVVRKRPVGHSAMWEVI